jgi:hypothetical protein
VEKAVVVVLIGGRDCERADVAIGVIKIDVVAVGGVSLKSTLSFTPSGMSPEPGFWLQLLELCQLLLWSPCHVKLTWADAVDPQDRAATVMMDNRIPCNRCGIDLSPHHVEFVGRVVWRRPLDPSEHRVSGQLISIRPAGNAVRRAIRSGGIENVQSGASEPAATVRYSAKRVRTPAKPRIQTFRRRLRAECATKNPPALPTLS